MQINRAIKNHNITQLIILQRHLVVILSEKNENK